VQVRERLDILDGLRGIAILLVVTYHVVLVSGQAFGPLAAAAQAGYLGVDLFFFISGFCLFYPYARALIEGRPQPTTRHFFARRFLKIVPSYLVALAVFAIVYHERFVSPQDALLQIGSHLTFLHTLNPATYGTISGPLWTIGIEVQFYLLFPFIAGWFARSPVIGYLALAALSEAYRLALGGAGLDTEFGWINQLPAFFDVFGAGMLAAYALVALRERGTQHVRTATVASGAAFAVAIGGYALANWLALTAPIDDQHVWLNAVRVAIGPLCLVLTLATFFAAPRWKSIVAAPLLVSLSAISYNLYLWHLEIAVWLHATGLPSLVSALIALPVAIGVAALITYRFEQPILQANLGAFVRTLAQRLRARVPLPLPLPAETLERAA
jgi:peptidoglycan/LPS O-acetylase OafA/YrhL